MKQNSCRPWNGCAPQMCSCGCGKQQECGQMQGGGFLLPRIIASGREWLRCCQTTLRVEGVASCAAPFTLVSVCAAGEPRWTHTIDHARRRMCLHVTIPLQCQVQDCQGCLHDGCSCVEVDTALALPVHPSECWRNSLMLLPCVRLVCAPCASQDLCFDAQLEILLESYMIRWEPCMSGPPKPVCPPPLPLYPQPCRP